MSRTIEDTKLGPYQMPRRNQLEHNTPQELRIRAMILEIEELGAHTNLTKCVVLLGQAKDALSDWHDKIGE